MSVPLMPKATAIWLIENTTLTFEQIGDFCDMHALEVQAMADEEVAIGMVGQDPVTSGQLTFDEIQRCQGDPTLRLRLSIQKIEGLKKIKGKYTPLAKRKAKPDGISWLVKEFPEMSNSDIIRLIGTTRPTIEKIRNRTYKDINEVKPQNPVHLGLCTMEELNQVIAKYKTLE